MQPSDRTKLKAAAAVKPLEWKTIKHSDGVYVDTVTGTYFAYPSGSWTSPSHHLSVRDGSIEDAKAAAQADYERRILSAIDLSALEARVASAEGQNEWLKTRIDERLFARLKYGIEQARDHRHFKAAYAMEDAKQRIATLLAEIEALEARVASAEGALRLFLKYNDADTSDVSTMLAYDDALCAARAHFQAQGGDHGRD